MAFYLENGYLNEKIGISHTNIHYIILIFFYYSIAQKSKNKIFLSVSQKIKFIYEFKSNKRITQTKIIFSNFFICVIRCLFKCDKLIDIVSKMK